MRGRAKSWTSETESQIWAWESLLNKKPRQDRAKHEGKRAYLTRNLKRNTKDAEKPRTRDDIPRETEMKWEKKERMQNPLRESAYWSMRKSHGSDVEMKLGFFNLFIS